MNKITHSGGKMRFKAFTLAEVLITLAIIGVVAAMTIPTLIANYQERAWNTSAEVFERKLEEALKEMNIQQTLAGYSDTINFVNELSKYLKITKICNKNDLLSCFEDKVIWGTEQEEVDMSKIKSASHFGQDKWNTETVGVQFANGVSGIIAYNPECKQNPFSNQITGTSCLAILYDTNGFKQPNTSSKDLRSINVSGLGKGCYAELDNLCIMAEAFVPTPVTYNECEQLKTEGYPIPNCGYEEDYWAGGVKQCTDMGGRLPTKSELSQMANYVYNTTGLENKLYQVSGLTLDQTKFKELGLKSEVWSSDEYNFKEYVGKGAYSRYFYPTFTSGTYSGRENKNDSSYTILCIK